MSTPPAAVDYKPGSAPPAAATRRHFCFGPLRCIPGIKAVDHSGATPNKRRVSNKRRGLWTFVQYTWHHLIIVTY